MGSRVAIKLSARMYRDNRTEVRGQPLNLNNCIIRPYVISGSAIYCNIEDQGECGTF